MERLIYACINNFQDSYMFFNPFQITELFLHPLKTSEHLCFSDVLGGTERGQWHEMDYHVKNNAVHFRRWHPTFMLDKFTCHVTKAYLKVTY